MKKNIITLLSLFVLLASGGHSHLSFGASEASTKKSRAIDLEDLKKRIGTEGLVGEVHSAAHAMGLYVFTYRDPEDFFNYLHISIMTRDRGVKEQMSQLSRHDRIKIWGSFGNNPSPQAHAKITALELLKKYVADPEIPKHDYQSKVPEDLEKLNRAQFLVHAIHAEGSVLVVEYGDAVLPVFVDRPEIARDLWRNDKITMDFEIQDEPGRPVHLIPSSRVENPINRYDAVQNLHWEKKKQRLERDNQEKISDDDPRLEDTISGNLILFPQSPQVNFDVWAIQNPDEAGIIRNYTIVNFDDSELFSKIREKLRKAWSLAPNSFVSGRNKLVNTRVKVRVRGKLNVISPNQANPQVMPDSLEAIEVQVDE